MPATRNCLPLPPARRTRPLSRDREQTQSPQIQPPQTTAAVTGGHRHRATGPPRNLTREPSRGHPDRAIRAGHKACPIGRKAYGSSPLVKFLHSQRCHPEHACGHRRMQVGRISRDGRGQRTARSATGVPEHDRPKRRQCARLVTGARPVSVAVQRSSAGLASKITSVSGHPRSTACGGRRSFASISEVHGLSKQSGTRGSFMEDQFYGRSVRGIL